jgi:hypothetical protein
VIHPGRLVANCLIRLAWTLAYLVVGIFWLAAVLVSS